MVLQPGGCGRVGRRRTITSVEATRQGGLYVFTRSVSRRRSMANQGRPSGPRRGTAPARSGDRRGGGRRAGDAALRWQGDSRAARARRGSARRPRRRTPRSRGGGAAEPRAAPCRRRADDRARRPAALGGAGALRRAADRRVDHRQGAGPQRRPAAARPAREARGPRRPAPGRRRHADRRRPEDRLPAHAGRPGARRPDRRGPRGVRRGGVRRRRVRRGAVRAARRQADERLAGLPAGDGRLRARAGPPGPGARAGAQPRRGRTSSRTSRPR